MASARDDLLHGYVQLLVGVVRMGADRAQHVVVRLGDLQECAKPADARRDRHEHADARRLGTADHAVKIVSEVGKVEVAVVIDEHRLAVGRPGQAKGRPNTPGDIVKSWDREAAFTTSRSSSRLLGSSLRSTQPTSVPFSWASGPASPWRRPWD